VTSPFEARWPSHLRARTDSLRVTPDPEVLAALRLLSASS
jgi:hypothetical protein